MINVLISGINGKMGSKVKEMIELNYSEEIQIVAGFDQIIKPMQKNVYSNIDELKELKIDAIIDFSRPETTNEILEFAKINKIPLVIGTTGINKELEDKIENYSKTFAIFKSGNMSYAIALMGKLLKEAYKYLKDWDIEIMEVHHNKKIDAPSGTAKLLKNKIDENRDIPMHSLRGGTVIGTHEVDFYGPYESIKIIHSAEDRNIFANGSIKALKYIIDKENGLYCLDDMFQNN